jgi:hypothetical protein
VEVNRDITSSAVGMRTINNLQQQRHPYPKLFVASGTGRDGYIDFCPRKPGQPEPGIGDAKPPNVVYMQTVNQRRVSRQLGHTSKDPMTKALMRQSQSNKMATLASSNKHGTYKTNKTTRAWTTTATALQNSRTGCVSLRTNELGKTEQKIKAPKIFSFKTSSGRKMYKVKVDDMAHMTCTSAAQAKEVAAQVVAAQSAQIELNVRPAFGGGGRRKKANRARFYVNADHEVWDSLAKLWRFERERHMRTTDFFRNKKINRSRDGGSLRGDEQTDEIRGAWVKKTDIYSRGDDLLDTKELGRLLKQIGVIEPMRKAQKVIDAFDADGNGELDVEELDLAMRVASQRIRCQFSPTKRRSNRVTMEHSSSKHAIVPRPSSAHVASVSKAVKNTTARPGSARVTASSPGESWF